MAKINTVARLRAARTTSASPVRYASGWVPVGNGVPSIRVTDETAMTIAPVFRAVELISGDIAGLPWHVNRVRGESREVVANHPVARLMAKPNPETTGLMFRQVLTANALLWGNGYAEIERSRDGTPIALWPLRPDQVSPSRTSNGALFYEVRGESGGVVSLPPSDMLHLRGLSPDGVLGYSVIALARRTFSKAIATEQYGASFFGNGGMPSGILKFPGKVSDDKQETIRSAWEKNYGKPSGGARVAILEQGFEYQALSMPPEDAQFLQTQKWDVVQIARWFGVPPHKLGDMEKMSYRNIEEQERAYVISTLDPWAMRWESETDDKLIDEEAMYNRMSRNARMRADHASRATFYTQMWSLGVLNTNEIRRLEDMDPIGPDGDVRYRPLNMDTLAASDSGEDPAIDVRREDDGETDEGADSAEPIEVLIPLVDATLLRSVRKVEKGLESREKYKAERAIWEDRVEKFICGLAGEIVENMQPCADSIARLMRVEAQPIGLWAEAWCQVMLGRVLKSEPVCESVEETRAQFIATVTGVE